VGATGQTGAALCGCGFQPFDRQRFCRNRPILTPGTPSRAPCLVASRNGAGPDRCSIQALAPFGPGTIRPAGTQGLRSDEFFLHDVPFAGAVWENSKKLPETVGDTFDLQHSKDGVAAQAQGNWAEACVGKKVDRWPDQGPVLPAGLVPGTGGFNFPGKLNASALKDLEASLPRECQSGLFPPVPHLWKSDYCHWHQWAGNYRSIVYLLESVFARPKGGCLF